MVYYRPVVGGSPDNSPLIFSKLFNWLVFLTLEAYRVSESCRNIYSTVPEKQSVRSKPVYSESCWTNLSKGVTCERHTDELHKKSFSTESVNPAPRHQRAIAPSSSVITL